VFAASECNSHFINILQELKRKQYLYFLYIAGNNSKKEDLSTKPTGVSLGLTIYLFF